MKSKKHILILTPGFPETESDSTCIPPLQAFVKALSARYEQDLDISVVAFQYPFFRGSYLWHGIRCWSAGGKNKKFPAKIITWLRIAIFIRQLHQKHPVDIVHSFWLHDCTLIGQWFSRLTGATHFSHAMGQDIKTGNSYIRYLTLKKLKVISNSPFSATVLKDHYNIPTHKVVPFGINPADFPDSTNSLRKVDLLAVGSLTSVKNHFLFIELFAALKKSHPGLTGSIIGDGPLAGKLRNAIIQHGLESCLVLEGSLARKEVLTRMTESKILLHTAAFESAAYVFLEALSSGMKVVCFQTGFLPESPDAYPCKGEQEMLQVLEKLLGEQQEYKKTPVPLISDTADAIFKIYNDPVSGTPEFIQ